MSLEPREFRNALGRFATGICVITAQVEGGKPFGMTINSFASVSLDPALVLWSLQKNSECAPLFDNITHYGINILSAEQQDVSNQYAKKGEHDLAEGSYRIGRSGAIVLNDAIVSFECEREATHEGGDHLILVAKVHEMQSHPADRQPLVFFSGKYRELK